MEKCPKCGHDMSDHATIPDPPKPGTLYTGCRAIDYGINPDDDLMCGCQVSNA